MLDGFIKVESKELLKAYNNIHHHRNEVSPFFTPNKNQDLNSSENGLMLDSFYGLVYDEIVLKSDSIYGPNELIPDYSGDNIANYGYLRVPFRKIPRVLVKSSEGLRYLVNSIWSKDPSLKLFFRGQTKEYLISRNPKTLKHLYGSTNVLEPSLLPSASRKKIKLEEILPEFSASLQLYCKIILKNIRDKSDEVGFQKKNNEYVATIQSYNLYFMSLALAQHYGLPSAGLDVTDDLDVALFFALNEFKPVKEMTDYLTAQRSITRGKPSVIYLLSASDRFYLNYEKVIPSFIQSIRPQRQSAKFLHTGWGYNSNDCARRLFMAVYLDSEGDFECKYNKRYLFPTQDEDSFGNFLYKMKSKKIPKNLKKFLSYFYWIK